MSRIRDSGHCYIRCWLDPRQASLSAGIRRRSLDRREYSPTAPAFSTVARGAVGARPSETVARPSPQSPPVNPEMFGNDLTCPRIPHADIQPCNCAATATSCRAAEIGPAVCPICHGPRTERGRAEARPTCGSEWPQTEHRIEARNTGRTTQQAAIFRPNSFPSRPRGPSWTSRRSTRSGQSRPRRRFPPSMRAFASL
jgi:hypothetical protein